MNWRLVFSLAWMFCAQAGWTQPIRIRDVSPGALRPGGFTEITISGQGLVALDPRPKLWISAPAEVEFAGRKGGDGAGLIYRVRLESGVSEDTVAVRLYGFHGVTPPWFIAVDALPSVPFGGRVSPREALRLPVGIDAETVAHGVNQYRVRAARGDRLVAEVVAQRVGSAMDPVLVLRDSSGGELAFVDDHPRLGVDCRLDYRCLRDGLHIIEVHDVQYRGGLRFRLRLSGVPVRDAASRLATLNSAGKGRDTAEAMSLPFVVHSRLAPSGAGHWYTFPLKEGAWLTVTPRTRSLGWPTLIALRLWDARNQRLMETGLSNEKEATLRFHCKTAGRYYLEVTDVVGRGGPDYGYRLAVTADRAPFDLKLAVEPGAPVDALVFPPGGVVELKVRALRSGYPGPIWLSAQGANDLYPVGGDLIAKGKNETTLRITMPRGGHPGDLVWLKVAGAASLGGRTYRSFLDGTDAFRALFPFMEQLPSWIERGIPAVEIAAPFRVEAETEGAAVTPGQPARIRVAVHWIETAGRLNEKREAIALELRGVPGGLRRPETIRLGPGESSARWVLGLVEGKPRVGGPARLTVEAMSRWLGRPFVLPGPSIELRLAGTGSE